MKHFFLVFLSIFLIYTIGFSQEVIRQKKFSGIDEIISSLDDTYYLIREESDFTLIDAKSQIQLGFLDVNFGNEFYAGRGKTAFLNDHRVLMNTMNEILILDLIEKTIDTLAVPHEYPELIENFHVLRNKDRVLISTKIFPTNKNGIAQPYTVNRKGEPEFDNSKNGRLYLFDFKNNKVVKQLDFPFSVTAFTESPESKEIFAGTFEGEILKIDDNLNYNKLFQAFDSPVYHISKLPHSFLVIPNLKKDLLFSEGKGELNIFSEAGEFKNKILLPEQDYPTEQALNTLEILPSNLIKNILVPKNSEFIYINYGFNKLVKFNPSSGLVKLKNDQKFANYHLLINEDKQIIVTASNEQLLFGQPEDLQIYDISNEKNILNFSFADEITEHEFLQKIYHGKNYYYLSGKDGKENQLSIYGSHTIRPSIIFSENDLSLNKNGNILFSKAYSNQIILARINFDQLKNDSIFINFGNTKDQDIGTDLLDIKLDSRTHPNFNLPFGISSIQSLDGHFILKGYNSKYSNFIQIIDSNGNLKFDKNGYDEPVIQGRDIKISTSEKFIARVKEKGSKAILEVWDWSQNKLIYEESFSDSNWWIYKFDETKDILWLRITVDDNTKIQKIDLSKSAASAETVISGISTTDFSVNEEEYLIAVEDGYKSSILNLRSGEVLWEEIFDSDRVSRTETGFEFSGRNGYYTVDKENFNSVFFTSFEGDKSVEITSDFYYTGNKSALKNLGIRYQNSGYYPSDYDIILNRPDIVLKRSGSNNDELLAQLKNAISKRNGSLPTTDFSDFVANAPLLKIKNRKEFQSYTTRKEINLALNLKSKTNTKLKSFQIKINGVPVLDSLSRTIEGSENEVSKSFTIQLNKGANDIQCFAIDENGFVSNKEIISVYADYDLPQSKTQIILISADTYDNSAYNLKYPVKDAKDFGRQMLKTGDSNVTVDSLFNDQITSENIQKIKEKLSNLSINDRVILFVSGHGVLDRDLNFRFATPDMDFEDVNNHGLTNKEIEKILLSSPARKRLLLIDACHSGELDKDSYLDGATTSGDVKIFEGAKGSISQSTRPASNSFRLMNEMFTNLASNKGIRVISAAAGNSYALESDDWQNGVFTYSLLSTLREQESMSVSELKEKTYSKVLKLTDGYQQPTSRGESIEWDWEIK